MTSNQPLSMKKIILKSKLTLLVWYTSKVVNCKFILCVPKSIQVKLHFEAYYSFFFLFFFQDTRHAAEGEIYTKLNQKIDEFIQLADYEWNMAESDGRASGYLMDLINFLRSTFQVFTHLPVSLMNSFVNVLTFFFFLSSLTQLC